MQISFNYIISNSKPIHIEKSSNLQVTKATEEYSPLLSSELSAGMYFTTVSDRRGSPFTSFSAIAVY